MATTPLTTVLHKLRRSFLRQAEQRITDGQLLERFVDVRDEAAFEALLSRHGPMVLGICRRVLRSEADVEDAFQATFLVLVRKAACVTPPERVGNWLYGVAHRTALKARAMNSKRCAKEREAAARRQGEAVDGTWEGLREILDRELCTLPDKYRAAIVLCDLEGKTIKQAAERLGCPPATIGTRLARGRSLLSRRLARRGVALSGGVLATVILQNSPAAGVPPLLLHATLQAALRIGAGQAARSVISTKVAALTKGVLKAMLLTKLKMALAGTLVLAVLGAGAAGLTYQAQPAEQAEPTTKVREYPMTTEGKRGALNVVGGDEAGEPSPQPKQEAKPTGILILDNCDAQYRGKETYQDNLTLLDLAGTQLFRVSGFNNCETIGSSHMIATDATRKCIWVIENVAHCARRFDFTGKETLTIPQLRGSAIAIDPETGNVWALVGETIHGTTVVYDHSGKMVASYNAAGGWDLAYDPNAKAFWIAGQRLTKIDAGGGQVIFSAPISTWCASSIDVDPRGRAVWVTVRQHPQVPGSRNRLLKFDTDGKELVAIDLGPKMPFRVSVDRNDGSVWVANLRKSVERFSAQGKSEAEYSVAALAVQVDPAGGDVWVVTPAEVQKMTPQGNVTKRVRHASNTSQAWIAALN